MIWDSYHKARMEERSLIVRFLRQYTNLTQFAQLLDDAAHLKSEQDLRVYCKKHGINLK